MASIGGIPLYIGPVTKRDDTYYAAMLARDHRFDGKFFVGVKTTGIYCRPICPAKPQRKNVEFFSSASGAERAGYRPCLRCRPESAPHSPAWIGTSAVVRRALRVLHHPDTLDFRESEFASQFGVTPRHLRRLFTEELGKTPKQIATESRLNLARQLLAETSLPVAEVAFAAGFNSLRRFNDAFRLRFHRSPREIRRSGGLTAETGTGWRVSLAYRPPFDFAGLLETYDRHRVADLEWVERESFHRVVEWGGKFGTVKVTNDPERSRLLVDIDFPDPTATQFLLARIRAMFDLDSDPLLVANQLDTDPALSRLLARFPGSRLPSGWDGFEIAISTILGQLVSVERGRSLVRDLVEIAGRDSGFSARGRNVKLFPSPSEIVAADLTTLKTTGMRKRTLVEFSRAVAEGRISLSPAQDVDEFLRRARSIPGIGPWTAEYIALKALRHTDTYPATDLILARALTLHPPAVLERMSPWRGYVAALCWRAYSGTLTKKTTSKGKRDGKK